MWRSFTRRTERSEGYPIVHPPSPRQRRSSCHTRDPSRIHCTRSRPSAASCGCAIRTPLRKVSPIASPELSAVNSSPSLATESCQLSLSLTSFLERELALSVILPLLSSSSSWLDERRQSYVRIGLPLDTNGQRIFSNYTYEQDRLLRLIAWRSRQIGR